MREMAAANTVMLSPNRIVFMFQSFRIPFIILSLKSAGNVGVLAYLRRSASRRSESLNLISLLLISMHEDFCQFLFQFIPIDITGDNGTVGGEEDRMREGINSVKRSRNVLGIDDLRIGDAEFADGFFCFLGFVTEGKPSTVNPFSLYC